MGIYDSIVKKEPITKGWSENKKYCVTTTSGEKYLLRVSPTSRYKTEKCLFELLEQAAALNVSMCVPVEFGTCDDGIYSIQSWIDGVDLKTVLPSLSEADQYILGIKAGEILRKIHGIPVLETHIDYWTSAPLYENWATRFNRNLDNAIKDYHSSELRFDGDAYVFDYINNNRHLLDNRPQCFGFDDFNVMNMMFSNNSLVIIDFERYNIGDPWEEFSDIVWSVKYSHHFATGQIRGYFNGEPPKDFFMLLALYFANYLLKFWKSQPITNEFWRDITIELAQNVLKWFNHMRNPIPTWYLKDLCIQQIDGVSYQLESPFDFSFISKYGKVFTAFDEQGSGNIAFGVEKDGKKYFIKFAGAPKKNYIANRESGAVDNVSAVKMLKAAVPLYTELAHPALIKFVSAEEIGGGYAAVFEWEDTIGIEPKGSPDYMRFMQMPIEKKMRAFEDIVEFHAHVAEKGYVALDFYDGSILYDYDKEKVIICDIDLYQKLPFINADGLGIVGSARYVSPEECVKDAIMDEITNVYTMGATAFALFAFGDRSPEAWTLNKDSYDVAKKAVNDERNERQQSLKQFLAEWRTAISEK